MKKILIIGASGFIGSSLIENMAGYDIHTLKGRSLKNSAIGDLSECLSGYDAIINLAGKSIMGRWSKINKKEIYESRVLMIRKIAEALNLSSDPPPHFINASAIGVYKPEILADEFSSELAFDFLGKVVQDLEREASKIQSPKTKLSIVRIGVVLGKEGGAYKIFRKLSSLNLGAVFKGGNQSLSYIGIHDLVSAMDFILQKQITGIINLVNPDYSNYKTLNALIKKHTNALISWNIPGLILKLVFSERSSMFLQGHKIKPTVLLKNSFIFETPILESCVDKIEGN